jgi:hypothetical protein
MTTSKDFKTYILWVSVPYEGWDKSFEGSLEDILDIISKVKYNSQDIIVTSGEIDVSYSQ